MWWLGVLIVCVASWALSRAAVPDTFGAVFFVFMLCVVTMGVCWRVIEKLLHVRFPTKVEHTVAARNTAMTVLIMPGIQAVLVVAGW